MVAKSVAKLSSTSVESVEILFFNNNNNNNNKQNIKIILKNQGKKYLCLSVNEI